MAPKFFIKSLMDSDHPIRKCKRLVTLCFLLTEHIYLVTNFSDKHWKEVIVFGDKWWNHDKAGPARLDGKTLHSRASLLVYSVMIWRKCIRWSKGSSRPLYIWNFGKTKCAGASWC